MQEKTKTIYEEKAEKIIKYINNNLAGDLSIKTLAELAAISHYHFHRIMKAILNESLGKYIDRVRLETAVMLLRYSEDALLEIAMKIGYQDLSSFSRAFKKHFGITPQYYRGDKSIVLDTNIDFRISETEKIFAEVSPKLINLPDRRVIYIRVVGVYGGEESKEAWEELGAFIEGKNIVGWNKELYSVYHDNPEEVGMGNCRSDLCIGVSKNVELEGRIDEQFISGGKFLMYRYKGPYERLWDLYDYIFKKNIITSDIVLRNAPSLEKYCNYSPSVKPEDLITEIYIPVE